MKEWKLEMKRDTEISREWKRERKQKESHCLFIGFYCMVLFTVILLKRDDKRKFSFAIFFSFFFFPFVRSSVPLPNFTFRTLDFTGCFHFSVCFFYLFLLLLLLFGVRCVCVWASSKSTWYFYLYGRHLYIVI